MKKALKSLFWMILLIIVVFLYREKDRVIDRVLPLLSDTKLVEARELNEQTPEGYTFYYDQLTGKEQTAYRAVLYGILHEQDEFYIGDDYTKEDLKRIMYAFTYDYPEYYWCLQYQMKVIAGQAYYVILDREEDQKEISGLLESEADKITKKVLKQKGKYKQIKAIYDYIIQHTDYVENSRYDQDIRSVLLHQQSVCSGYAKTFQYLCKLANIKCTTVNGYSYENKAVKNPHAWNLVYLQGNYYWVDVTWGDSHDTSGGEFINYSYFLSTDASFLKTHKIDEYLDQQIRNTTLFEYPACTDVSLNYYRKKGCYFKSYDRAKMKQYLSSRLNKNLYQYVELKFANQKTYKKAYQDLFQDGYIREILMDCIPPNTKISYGCVYDDETNLIYFYVDS